MVDRMRSVLASRGLDCDVDEQAVVEMIVERHGSARETVYLQERHISQAFQEALFRAGAEGRASRAASVSCLVRQPKLSDPTDHVGVQNELRSHLMKAGKPAFVEESFLSFAEARRLVLELGGIPSYPVLADGASPICEFEIGRGQAHRRAQRARDSCGRVDTGPQQGDRRRGVCDEDASGGAHRHGGHRAQYARLDPVRSSLQRRGSAAGRARGVLGRCVRRRGASVPVAAWRMWIRR